MPSVPIEAERFSGIRESAANGKSDAALSVAPPGLEPGLS